jgi:nucleoside-diphosphate-sugar epimerase
VTINRLVDYVEEIAGIKLERSYKLVAPKGVAGRNSDNTEFKKRYGWEPKTSLRDGLARTYEWIEEQVKNELRGATAAPAGKSKDGA